MHRSLLLTIIIASLVCLFVNYFSHHSLFTSLINSLALGLSILLFQNYLALKNNTFNNFLLISLGLMPIFSYQPDPNLFAVLPLAALILIYLYIKQPNKYLIIIWIIYIFFGHLYLSEVIKYPFSLQDSQLIFNSPEVNLYLNQHQQDALFLPYKVRQLFYSETIYIYAALTNFFDFLNLKNLYEVLILANLYLLFTGIYKIFTEKDKLKFFFITTFSVTMLTAGIDRSPDKFQSLYLLGPLLLYLILVGAQGVNKKIYLFFWALSFFIYISPKI